MAATIKRDSHIFGIRPRLPLAGFPSGAKIRIRLRHDQWAVAVVKTPESISRHFIIERDGCWHMSHSGGLNIKIT